MSQDMKREFTSREELIAYVRQQFPSAEARDSHVSPTLGGRKAAETALEQVDPAKYASTRNFLNGAVTRLSPYLRYGVLSLAEVRDVVLAKVRHQEDAVKLVNELGWRDYWQRLYAELGKGIWQDREEYKTGYTGSDYSETMPQDVIEGTTGLVCIDSISRELRETGYLHNHQRMWTAAYLVHWRRVKWQAGARWFLEHLLDGDPASNHLSWQWVASTFSHKAYFFNRENLERYTKSVYCRDCPLYVQCDFEGSYEQLEVKLFPSGEKVDRSGGSKSWARPKKTR
jgi:deoxyribodipyrimidine photo-lyase